MSTPLKEKQPASGSDDSEDEVPIALSRMKKPLKKEPKQEVGYDDDDEEDHQPLVLANKLKKKSPSSNMSRLKKEKEDDESDDAKPEKKKMAGSKQENNSNARLSNVKKEGREDDQEEEGKQLKKNEKEEKKKTIRKRKKGDENGIKKERKVYDFPGQKHDPPEERDPLRIFYETLYQQVPTSEMAEIWMMEWGLLPPLKAKEVYEKKVKKYPHLKTKSPVKGLKAVSVKRTVKVSVKDVKKDSSAKTKSKLPRKRMARDGGSDEDDDDDFVSPPPKAKKQKLSR